MQRNHYFQLRCTLEPKKMVEFTSITYLEVNETIHWALIYVNKQ